MKKISKKAISVLVIFTLFLCSIMATVPVYAAGSLTHDYSEINTLPSDYSYGTLYWTDDTQVSLLEDANNTTHTDTTIRNGNEFKIYYVQYSEWAANHNKMVGLRITNCAVDKDGDICENLMMVKIEETEQVSL